MSKGSGPHPGGKISCESQARPAPRGVPPGGILPGSARLAAPQKTLCRGGEGAFAFPEAFEREDDKCTVARGEVREFMRDREIARARDRDQDRILRCGRRAIGYR